MAAVGREWEQPQTREALYIYRHAEVRSSNHCSNRKVISITYWWCVFVAFVIQHAMRMRRIVIYLRPAPLYNISPHCLIKADFLKKVIEYKMCVLISSATFVWNISHSKKNWARYDQKRLVVFMYSTRYFWSILNENWIFSTVFRKIFTYQISWKFVWWDQSCSKRTDGQTHVTKLMDAFRNFANVHKNLSECIRAGYPEHDAGTEKISQFLLKYNIDNLKSMLSVCTDWLSDLTVPKNWASDLSGIQKPTASAVACRARKTCFFHLILQNKQFAHPKYINTISIHSYILMFYRLYFIINCNDNTCQHFSLLIILSL